MPTLHIATRLSFTQFSQTYREFIAFGKSASELRKRLYMLIEYGRILEKMLSSGALSFAQLHAFQATMSSPQNLTENSAAVPATQADGKPDASGAPVPPVIAALDEGPEDYGIPVHLFS